MTVDIFTDALRSVAWRSPMAPFLIFMAGALSSFGPCFAPRFIAVIACVGSHTRRAPLIITCFLSGLVAAYASFGFATSLIGHLLDLGSWTYGSIAIALLAGGIITICRAEQHDMCSVQATQKPATSLGGVFLLGASFALVVAPCCTPMIANVFAYTTDIGDPFYSALMLALFALGHGIPLALIGLGAGATAEYFHRFAAHQATTIVSGALMIILSAFYWCLV